MTLKHKRVSDKQTNKQNPNPLFASKQQSLRLCKSPCNDMLIFSKYHVYHLSLPFLDSQDITVHREGDMEGFP